MQMNPLIQMLMKKLQIQNPTGFQIVNEALQNNGNPSSMVQQLMGNISPEQRQSVLTQAKGYGCPDSILSQIQNMK